MITADMFLKATGRNPVDDDLDRSNCKQAGDVGHYCCGWDDERNLPAYMTGKRIEKTAEQG